MDPSMTDLSVRMLACESTKAKFFIRDDGNSQHRVKNLDANKHPCILPPENEFIPFLTRILLIVKFMRCNSRRVSADMEAQPLIAAHAVAKNSYTMARSRCSYLWPSSRVATRQICLGVLLTMTGGAAPLTGGGCGGAEPADGESIAVTSLSSRTCKRMSMNL